MPQMTFAPENKSEDPTSFPKLRLERDGRARIACLENPEFGYMHRLTAPKLVNDKPTYEENERTGGTTMVMDFIGRPICLGDMGVMKQKKSDPAHCPACRKAQESDRIGPAQRRFAMHVVSYSLMSGGFIVADPFSISIKVWAYADSTFDKLSDFMQEWGPLSKHDLNLGPCTNVGFQKFDIAISNKAVWLEGGGGMPADQTQQMTARAFKSNRCTDLTAFLGRRVPQSFMEEDISRVENRWRLVDKHLSSESGPAPEDHDAALQSGLEDLLDSNPAVGAPPPAGTDLDVDKLLAGTGIAIDTPRESTTLSSPREAVPGSREAVPGSRPDGPTQQDLADIERMKGEVAASSAAAQAAPKSAAKEVSVEDILSGGDSATGLVQPVPQDSPASVVPTSAPTAPTSDVSTAKTGKVDDGEIDFDTFLKEFGG